MSRRFFPTKYFFYALLLTIISVAVSTTLYAQNESLNDSTINTTKSKDDQYTEIVKERKVPDSVLSSLKNDDAFWYANSSFEKKEKQKANNGLGRFFQNAAVRNLFWILFVGCCIAIIIWFLATSNIRLFRPKPKAIITENGDTEHGDIFSIDFGEEIKKAVQAANYRLAVRWLYLQLLKNMSGAAVIHYGMEKTNSDYLQQLQPTPYYKNFLKLTQNFEYVWYGKFHISEPLFLKMQDDFAQLNNQLPA